MECEHCKSEMPEGATVCPNCGRTRGDIQALSFLVGVLFMAALVLSIIAGNAHWWHEYHGILGYEWSWPAFLGSASGWAFIALAAGFFYALARLFAAFNKAS